MPRESPTTRKQRIERRRSQILDAAATAFAARGFERTRMQTVARRAGVADGTIYTYFGSKRELLVALLDRLHRTENHKISFGTRPPTDLAEFLETYFRQRLQRLWHNRGLLRALLPQLLIDEQLRARYRREVLVPMLENSLAMFARQVSAQRAAEHSADGVVRGVAALVSGTMLMALLEEREPAPELPGQLAALVIGGIGRR